MKSEYTVLTPESVEFVYELGGLGSRMVAALLDHLIVAALLIGVWLIALTVGMMTLFLTLVPMIALALLAVFLVNYGYFVFFEWRWNGQTPGKRAMELRVIDDRGMNIDLFQALVRNLVRLVDLMPLFYGFGGLASLLNRRHKRLGDWAAGTLVVRTRKRVLPGAIVAPNEKYNSLQEDPALRSRIRSRLSLEEREMLLQLCLRRHELEIEPRQALFSDAAAYLEQRLEIAREPFISEEKFVQNIAAVALGEQETPGPRRSPLAAGQR